MKCPYCGKEIKNEALACPYCWKDIPDKGMTTSMESQLSPMPATILNKPDSLPENLSSLWELTDEELNTAYHSSTVLRRIGMIMYFILLPFFLPFLFSLQMIIMGILLFIIINGFTLYPLAFVLRNVRSIKAQKRLMHITVFSEICGAISLAIILGVTILTASVNAYYITGENLGRALFFIIYLIIFLYVHRHVKNKLIFSNTPFSHAEIQYVKESRMQTNKENIEYPVKYSYGKLAKIAMFLCPLMYLFSLIFNMSAVGDVISRSTKGETSRIPQEKVQYAEDCVKEGNIAVEANDFAKASEYYEKAANIGHPEARLNLGIIHAKGLVENVDYEKAFHLLSDNEIIVAPIAKYYVGLLYYTGQGTQQDFKLAGQYLQASAKEGYKPAQDFLGYKDENLPDYGMPLEEMLKRNWEKNK